MKLSVALATFNEEEFLPQCLDSVAGWVGEIVVADGGSIDETQAIAKKYKARLFIYENPPIFHINKQHAIDKCKGEWILQLDADEKVSKELKQEILEVINEKSDINGYWIPRKNFFLGKFLKKGGQYPDYTTRLYKKGKAHLPCKSVHEQAIVEGKTEYLKNALLHYADASFKRYLVRFNRYTNLIASELREENTKKNIFTFILFIFIKPLLWFLKTSIRHKGFMDGWQGVLFSFFSSLRFPVAYLKFLSKLK